MSEDDSSIAQDTAGGAATGSSFGPWGALIGAAGGLMLGLMNNKAKAQQQDYQAGIDEHMRTANAVTNAQNQQLNTVGQFGPSENSAIQNLMGVFARAR